MDETQPQAPAEALRRPPKFRWKIGLAILLTAVLVQAVLWTVWDDWTRRILALYYIWPGALFLLLVWWTFLSGLRWRTRLGALAALAAVVVAALVLVQWDGFRGDMVPRVSWRFGGLRERDRGWERIEKAEPSADTEEPLALSPGDWPNFRGPNRDAVVDARVRRDWEERPPQLMWKHPVGRGWSSFAVVDDLAWTQEQRGSEETVVCYRLSDGKEVWVHSDRAQFSEALGGEGPRATPTFYDSRIYALGATGILNCLDARTGELLWSRDILDEAGASNLPWAMAGSPLVYENMVVVNPGGRNARSVVAYDRSNGKLLWSAGESKAAYSSPILATIDGATQVLVFDGEGLSAYDSAGGGLLWVFPWRNAEGINVAQPLVLDDGRVLISTGYGIGTMLLQVSRQDGRWSAAPLWPESSARNLRVKFNDVVHKDGFVYGLDEGILTCIDLTDGNRRWKRGRYGYGQLLLAGDLLLIQAEEGEVVLVEAIPDEHREVARFAALNDKTWNHPVLVRGRLLVRNAREAACYNLD